MTYAAYSALPQKRMEAAIEEKRLEEMSAALELVFEKIERLHELGQRCPVK